MLQYVSERELSMTDNLNEQTFYFKQGKIRYSNTQFTELRSSPYNDNLEVKNVICEQIGKTLIKVTQIRIGEQCFTIKDEFTLEPDSMQRMIYDREIRNSGETSERGGSERRKAYEKGDTKNLTKNIINLFLRWLKHENLTSPSKMYQKVKNKLKSKIKAVKYFNKKLLTLLSHDSQICELFSQFSEKSAIQMIESSRIQDKNSHKNALSLYCQIFTSKQKAFSQKKTQNSHQNEE